MNNLENNKIYPEVLDKNKKGKDQDQDQEDNTKLNENGLVEINS